jgi:hypothetical protein
MTTDTPRAPADIVRAALMQYVPIEEDEADDALDALDQLERAAAGEAGGRPPGQYGKDRG